MTGAEYAFRKDVRATAADEQRRLAAVRRYAVLDTPPDGTFDKIASLAARIFDVPMATVAIVDSDRVRTAVFDAAADGCFTVTLAGGGHPSTLAVRADGTVEPVSTSGGQLIGLLPDPHFVQVTTRLAPGDALLLYTDGLIEARTADGSMLGEEGPARHLSVHVTQGADSLLATVHKLFTGLGTGVSDDTALLALSVPHPRTPPPAQENR
ncbi:PP2C family protein-serine/threonine phosphatase [Streptomyces sp. NPDC093544]|uniref:PP2C family protein-serine/threonine phosphatase n=1 Tax=Streptomyces sp. NPDC093544 TaxID=3155200 RepID=UPI0034222164